jgi:predicted Kef-type K+ transport protein
MNQAKKKKRHNSTYKKLAVQRLYEVLFFVSSSVLADSFVLRNRQLLLAANRWQTANRWQQL